MSNSPLHPTAARLVLEMCGRSPLLDPSYLQGWVLRAQRGINGAVSSALEPGLRIVECFAGIGGLGTGLETALDGTTILQAEADAARRRVLAKHFPLALHLPDVKDIITLPAPDDPNRLILSGGFPCRGASKANLTGPRGLAHPRTGLWWVMADALRRWRPLGLIWENVPGLRSRGLGPVLQDINDAGYDALWGIMRASDFGAPHERARLFCVAVRRGAPLLSIDSWDPPLDWTPWHQDIPNNDAGDPNQSPRVKALGDAVLPIVAWAAGRTAAKALGGWWPSKGTPYQGDHPPINGCQRDGRVLALRSSPFEVYRPDPTARTFVTIDESLMDGSNGRVAPPMVGRIALGSLSPDMEDEDLVDVELPGGWPEPFPLGWLKPLWPTLTSNDGRNKGARSQWKRRSKALNVLAQANTCPREEWATGEAIVQMFAGQGVGPGFGEWVMGFPEGWTKPIGGASPKSSTINSCQLSLGFS